MSNPETQTCEHGGLGCGVRWECNGCAIDRLEARNAVLEQVARQAAHFRDAFPFTAISRGVDQELIKLDNALIEAGYGYTPDPQPENPND